jgi:hypothetical protein
MTQLLQPDSNIDVGGWTGDYTDVDETSPSDADYMTVNLAADAAESFTLGLSNVTDPIEGRNHVVSIRTQIPAEVGTQQATWVATLKQGASIDVASDNWTDTDGGGWTTHTFTLTQAEVDLITDFTDLRVVVAVTTNVGNSVSIDCQCSWVQMSVPDVPTLNWPSVRDSSAWKTLIASSSPRDGETWKTFSLIFVMDGGYWKPLVAIT